MKRASVPIDPILLQILAIVVVSYFFRGATSFCDGVMHLSKVKILLDNLEAYAYFPRWNPYWYFGVPMWRIYSPLSYYIIAFLGWILHLSVEDVVMIWAYLVFSSISASTWLLAREMGLKRLGSFVSSLVFLLSANLIFYWGIGSYPTVTGVAFSALATFFFLRAVKKRSTLNILVAGVSFGGLILTYFMNAIILLVFFVVLSVLIVVRNPSLLYISRGLRTPPRYTLVLPKILFSTILVALGVSMWWVLPFLATYLAAPAIPGITVGPPPAPRSLEEQLVLLLGVQPNMESPGIGHFILATVACITVAVKRRTEVTDAPVCFIMAFVFCLTPWLLIPTGPLFWRRFTLYLSLFASLCGGIFVDLVKDSYESLLDQTPLNAQDKRPISTIYSSSLVVLILLAAIYPVAGSESIVFSGVDISRKPEYIDFLESHTEVGERVGMDGGYAFNLYTGIPQSGGGNIHYVYMVNEFAYLFWRYMFVEQDSRYLRYFARNYNVRWFVGAEKLGLMRTDHEVLHEVVGFDWSLFENVGSDNLVLFVGDATEYSLFFLSLALSDPDDIVAVYGGSTLDGYDVDTLGRFGVVYTTSLRSEDPLAMSQLLSQYAGDGGCLILDTGNLEREGEVNGLPEPSPVDRVSYGDSYLMFEPANLHNVTRDLDFTKFRSEKLYVISHANSTRKGSSVLICDEDRPILVHRQWGSGEVFWTGLRLPYLIMLDEKDEARSAEEAKLLINLLRQAESTEDADQRGIVRFEQKGLEEMVVYVEDGSLRDALWLKMSYYPGWTAQIKDHSDNQLRIFMAGPNMMLVFPESSGDYAVGFHFDKTMDVKLGELISIVSCITLLAFTFYSAATRRLRKDRSSHGQPSA